MEREDTKITKINFKKKNKILNVKAYYIYVVIKSVWYWLRVLLAEVQTQINRIEQRTQI